MNVDLEPGTYVVAVSGGVDSMALLDMLAKKPGLRLIVAHYDHGIRPDSPLDRELVQEVAWRHGLEFVYDEGHLGPNASEETARDARYAFLHQVRQASGAKAIVTAHHQDDMLETAILNMLRGTGRQGLVALRSRPTVKRPLLHIPKQDLISYAKKQRLSWREDSTNAELLHFRNYVRHQILPLFNEKKREELLQHISNMHELHTALETELINHLHLHPKTDELDRHWFIMLPHAVAREVLATWLRRHGVNDVSSSMLERLVVAAKTLSPGRQSDVDKIFILQIGKENLALKAQER